MFIFVLLLTSGYDYALQGIYGVPYSQAGLDGRLGRGDPIVEDYKLYDPRLVEHYAAIVGNRLENKWVVMDVLGHLARMPYVNTKLLGVAPRWATHPEHRMRATVMGFLAVHGQPRHAPVIATLLYDQREIVCYAAVDAMAHIVTPESLLALEVWLARPPYSLADGLEKRVADHIATLRVKLAERGRLTASWPPFPVPPPQVIPPGLVPVEAPRRKPKE